MNLLSNGGSFMDESLLNYNETVEYVLKDFFNKQRAMCILPTHTMSNFPDVELFNISNNSWTPDYRNVDRDFIRELMRLQKQLDQQTAKIADHQFGLSLGKQRVGAGYVPYLKDSPMSRQYFADLTKVIKMSRKDYKYPPLMELLVLSGDESLYNPQQHTTTFLWLKTTPDAIRDHGNDWIKEHWIPTDIK